MHHVPRPSRRARENDLFARALAEIPSKLVADYDGVLRHFAQSVEFKQWVNLQTVDCERHRGYFLATPIMWGRSLDGTTSRGMPTKCLDFSFISRFDVPDSRFQHDLLRLGAIWIDGIILDDLRIEFNGAEMAALSFRCGLTLGAQLSPSRRDELVGMPVTIELGFYRKKLWLKPMNVPLKYLDLWANGKHEDIALGIEIIHSDKLVLQYPNASYPKSLYQLFRDLGPHALKKLRDRGCIDEESWQSISSRFEKNYPSNKSEIPGEDDLESVSNTPHPETDPIIAARIEAVEVSKEDREKIEIVDGVKGCKSYRKWAELMGYKSGSVAFAFFKRNEEKGLLVTKKGPGGIGIYAELTEKGKRVIGAF